MKISKCVRCNKTLASPQSLWNHRQRCKTNDEKFSSSNESTRKPEVESTSLERQKFINDIISGGQTERDQPMSSIQPTDRTSIKSNELIDFKSVKKPAAETDWDSESTLLDSISEAESEIFEENEHMLDNLQELKAAFRYMYKKIHSNMETYKNLVSILDELHRVNFLTKEECNALNLMIQKKISIV